MSNLTAQWERKNKEIRRVFRVLVHAFRRAGFGKYEVCDGVVVFRKPQIKIILKNLDKEDIDPEIIIRFWR